MTDTTAPVTDPCGASSDPGRLWTLINAGEAKPDILSPLCWSLWGAGDPGTPNQWNTAINVDRARELAGLLPGMAADDFEHDLLGSVRPDAIVSLAGWGVTSSADRSSTGRACVVIRSS
jgi:hypothetical protein